MEKDKEIRIKLAVEHLVDVASDPGFEEELYPADYRKHLNDSINDLYDAIGGLDHLKIED